MIECVEYNRIERHGVEGVQITFTMGDSHFDTYEFFDQVDIEHMVRLMAEGISPESLMVAIRKRMNITVH